MPGSRNPYRASVSFATTIVLTLGLFVVPAFGSILTMRPVLTNNSKPLAPKSNSSITFNQKDSAKPIKGGRTGKVNVSQSHSKRPVTLIEPKYGQIRLGAFSGEAAHLAGLTYISTVGLSNPLDYAAYRASIRNTYGVDLEDMNYFSLEPTNLDSRLNALQSWIHLAGEYGDVTLALEPLGPTKYDVFKDKVTMLKLAAIFSSAESRGITIWVRFASESNLPGSEYRAVDRPQDFYEAAQRFKSQMPKNVKLVFSPLLNTFYAGQSSQKSLAKKMLFGPNSENKIWDRIGGTIYRTDLSLSKTFNYYYDYLSKLAPNTPFQICEVGGPYARRSEIINFLESCSQGKYPQLVKVNLFAREINRRADPNSEFGFLEPVERATKTQAARTTKTPQLMDSFLKPVLESAKTN